METNQGVLQGIGGDLLRERLVAIALEWQRRFGVAPRITSNLSEYDAAHLIGLTENEYSKSMQGRTAVSAGNDFEYGGLRYQVKSNRPSGGKGSYVTLVSKPKNYDWDRLIWILYDEKFCLAEAWLWDVGDFKEKFDKLKRLRPKHIRQGRRIDQPREYRETGDASLTAGQPNS
jgi:hypothetical protein